LKIIVLILDTPEKEGNQMQMLESMSVAEALEKGYVQWTVKDTPEVETAIPKPTKAWVFDDVYKITSHNEGKSVVFEAVITWVSGQALYDRAVECLKTLYEEIENQGWTCHVTCRDSAVIRFSIANQCDHLDAIMLVGAARSRLKELSGLK
jgi:hypothetical protein